MKRIRPDDVGLAIPRYTGKNRRGGPAKAKTPESVTQDLVEQYLALLGLPKLHIPEFLLANAFGRAMSGAELGAARDAADEVRGFPDLVIFYRGRYAAIELKTPIGKMTHAQIRWQKMLNTVCCRSFETAKEFIDEWMVICET